MTPLIKNSIIVFVIAILGVGGYMYFSGGSTEETSSGLVSTTGEVTGLPDASVAGTQFLNLLLSVQSIKLDDSLFNKKAFITLRDSTVTLVNDNNEGRPNPFAPIGNDIAEPISKPSLQAETELEEDLLSGLDDDLLLLEGLGSSSNTSGSSTTTQTTPKPTTTVTPKPTTTTAPKTTTP
ncbi:MAG: hypothetical protein K9L98_00940 [Candidatus Pacebacteria bacterium]|nr:hypothetical protein [Candidatus Paceibacterota bacterium]MCF7862561.1 hypothetical protein [Candidatus Paceibacterota bacterium]